MFHTRDGRILSLTEIESDSSEVYIPRIQLTRIDHTENGIRIPINGSTGRNKSQGRGVANLILKHKLKDAKVELKRIDKIPKLELEDKKSVPKFGVTVKQEMVEEHGEKTWSCVPCKVNFLSKIALKAHFKTWEHSVQMVGKSKASDFLHDCQFCGKLFAEQQERDDHEDSHKPYACKICNKRFTQSGQITIHKRIHTQEFPYSCPICKKRFNQKTHMQRHLKIHFKNTAESEYPCPQCSMKFNQRGNLSRHLLAHENGTIKRKCLEKHRNKTIKVT